jgi:glycosyltransferase involved in cell wall biosynthesis
LAKLVGVDVSTSSERRYATEVLPRGFFRGLRLGVLNRSMADLQRSITILAGLVWAVAGMVTEFVAGKRHSGLARDPQTTGAPTGGGSGDGGALFRPVHIAEWDVLEAFSAHSTDWQADEGGGRVQLLVRLASEPLGWVDVEFADSASLAGSVADAAWQTFGALINDRLARSGLATVTGLPVGGLEIDSRLFDFVIERDRLLQDAPHVSVVLCTRDRPDRLARCVRRLALQHYPRFEIVVLVNAPADPGAVPAVLDALELPVPVRYLVEPRGGLSWARNTGWRAARGELVAFIDDDEVPDKFWLAEMLRGFAAGDRIGCVAGVVLPAELRTQPQDWFEQFGGHSKGRGFTRAEFGPGHPQSPLYPLPPFGTGANMAFRRDVLAGIDGFHVALGAGTPTNGAEDTFAFTRVLLARHTMVYQPTAVTWHYHRETYAELEKQLHGYGIGLTAYYAALLVWRPRLLLSFIGLIPTAIRDLRGKDSIRTATMTDFPVGLVRHEMTGMLEGVPAFVRSVREQRRKARS